MRAEKALEGNQTKGSGFFKCLLKGSLMALSISLILICIFAFVL